MSSQEKWINLSVNLLLGLASIMGNRYSGGTSGIIDYGRQKRDGSHDHRYDTGNDRTPAQKAGDKK